MRKLFWHAREPGGAHEPVTPEGCIYVTETMAAFLEVESSKRFVCDYVGYTSAAKNYGRMRMFLLRRTTSSRA